MHLPNHIMSSNTKHYKKIIEESNCEILWSENLIENLGCHPEADHGEATGDANK